MNLNFDFEVIEYGSKQTNNNDFYFHKDHFV